MRRLLTIASVVVTLAFLGIFLALQFGPTVHAQATRLNVVVVCSTCGYSGGVATILLDQNSGSLWAYPGGLGSGQPAIYLGKLSEVGKQLSK